MSVLLYAPVSKSIRERYQNEIEKLVPLEEIETYRTKEELSNRLRLPRRDIAVAVLILTDKKELRGILSLSELYRDLRIILLLPDRKKDTIAEGHRLRPRFLGYADSDLMFIVPVLKKMLKLETQHPALSKRGRHVRKCWVLDATSYFL
ncbi:MAG: hypothetical protein U9R17_02445 [Thermodesulfobacteriota bacterium]|nr:hypothetical protein [Thermodesulfobacteriota bacterium]